MIRVKFDEGRNFLQERRSLMKEVYKLHVGSFSYGDKQLKSGKPTGRISVGAFNQVV